MVFGNIRDLKDYSWLEEEVLKCFKYAQEHDLMAYEKAATEIDGDDLFVNIVEYETTTPQIVSGRRTDSIWICILCSEVRSRLM